MIPGPVVDAQSDEPAEQQVELHPLHQLALRAEAVERLQQPLRWDRRAAQPRRVQRREVRAQVRKRRVGDRPDRPQRMVPTNPRLQVHIREQRPCPLVRLRISNPQVLARSSESCRVRRRYGLLQQPARSSTLRILVEVFDGPKVGSTDATLMSFTNGLSLVEAKGNEPVLPSPTPSGARRPLRVPKAIYRNSPRRRRVKEPKN